MVSDSKRLIEITVRSQEEFDVLPDDFIGRIYIDFGTFLKRAIIDRAFACSVVALDNSSVEAWGNSSVEARGNSSVEAWGNSSVVARDNSSVEARGNSSVEAWGNSSVVARGNSSVEAWGNSSVVAWGNSSVEAWGNSSVVALDNSSVVAWDNSLIKARGNSSVVALDNSSVEARGNSSVVASGNVQVVNRQNIDCNIKVGGNARIVFMPKTIEEFMSFYNIEHDEKKAIFFKAVHRIDDSFVSDYDPNYKYGMGRVISNECDPNPDDTCSYGIHSGTLAWVIDFGREWKDLAIIEVETDIEKIVMPIESDGKVRTSEVKVLREVPLEECGGCGKILAKKLKNIT